MNSLKRDSVVPYSPQQMFELVNNIEEYPRFLPWCSKSTVKSRTDADVVAELEIEWKGMHKSFSTRNTLHPYNHMEISLVDGPMKHLEGKWQFLPVEGGGCHVKLELEFEFSGSFFDRLFEPIFQFIANSLVDAFTKRAVELYGNQ